MTNKNHWLNRFMTQVWKMNPEWAHALIKRKIFTYLFYIFPGVVIYFLLPILEWIEGETLLRITQRLCIAYIIGCILFILNALLLVALDIYNTKDKQRSRPMKGLIQVFQVLLFFLGGIIIVAVLINKSPATLFAGLGASAAILMLIFKDSILGFVAGVQLSANDMVRLGDWIQLPNGEANGTVQEISLNTVKIQNWDNTISTVPPYSLVNNPFKNWRGMQEGEGRRVDKTIQIDLTTLRFCTTELLNAIQKIPLMEDYVPLGNEIPSNAQLYRVYIERYLNRHPEVNHHMDLIVTQKEQTQYGLPIEVYFFLYNKVWKDYERIQSDIFDHLLTMVTIFDLKLYQCIPVINYSSNTSKSSFVTPQSGQAQSSGMDSKGVPGTIPLSGSPTAGS